MDASGWLDRAATPRGVAVSLAAFVLFSLVVLQVGAPLRQYGGLAIETTFHGPNLIGATLDRYGDAGRPLYRTFLLVDLLYPLFYAIPLAISLAYLAARTRSPWLRRLTAAPLAGGAFDWLENLGLLVLLGAYPRRLDALAAITSAVTAVKIVLVYGSFALAALALVVVLVRRRSA